MIVPPPPRIYTPPLVYAGPENDVGLEAWFNHHAEALLTDPRDHIWGVRGKLKPALSDVYPTGICRWCGVTLAGRRQAWCSDACKMRRGLRTWGVLRSFILLRDGLRCTDCGRTAALAKVKQLEVDHVHPVREGGNDHPNNLATKCSLCHREKSIDDARARRTAWEVSPR